MAETSLYRRHRPQSFAEVVGQEHVVRTLRNAVERDRVHHAYLFVGSRGTGKTSMAKILARSLNCVRGPTTQPCGECQPCRSIAAGTSLDVLEMDAASNRSVDDIRELRERVGYAPAEGRCKVYILDEAHMLTREAWNAFLKTLEDPPPSTVFVLATTEPHKVMPTIVDRCQRFDFGRPAADQIAEVLRRVAAAEQISLTDAALGTIARAASGSFRDALGTLDQLVAYCGTEIDTGDVLEVLGVADAELIFAAADAIASEDAPAALRVAGQLSGSGLDPVQFARDLIAHLRQLLVVRTAGEAPDSFTVTAADGDRVREQAERLGDAALVRSIDELSAAIAAIREGDDPRMTLELALLKAARPDLDPSRAALAHRLERLERILDSGAEKAADATDPAAVMAQPAPAGEPGADADGDDESGGPATVATIAERAAASAEQVAGRLEARAEQAGARATDAMIAAVDLERLTGLWPAVVDHVRESGSELLSTVFEAARPLAVDAERAVLEVGFPRSAAFNKRKAESQANRERLADAVRTIAGERLRPVYVLLDHSDEDDTGANGESELSDEELIERLKSEFDAEEFEPDEGATAEEER